MLIPPDRRCQIKAHGIHRGKGLVILLSVALSIMQVTAPFLDRFYINFEGEYPRGCCILFSLFPFHQPHQRTWGLTNILECTNATKALPIYKHPCLIRDSNPSPTAQQSASLTTNQMA
ncbi:hypothetical protein TNCV_2306971 [Trichonephila clavipes]|nr:hypothetical protein TNCV_2306971 [Trichonephila clavipes]